MRFIFRYEGQSDLILETQGRWNSKEPSKISFTFYSWHSNNSWFKLTKFSKTPEEHQEIALFLYTKVFLRFTRCFRLIYTDCCTQSTHIDLAPDSARILGMCTQTGTVNFTISKWSRTYSNQQLFILFNIIFFNHIYHRRYIYMIPNKIFKEHWAIKKLYNKVFTLITKNVVKNVPKTVK